MGRRKFLLLGAMFLITTGCAQGVDMSSTATAPSVGTNNGGVNPSANDAGPDGGAPTPVSGVPPSGGKSLFSAWVSTDGSVAIDGRLGEFNASKPLIFTTVTKQSCNCQGLTLGQASSGTVKVTSCSGNLSFGTLSCASFNGVAQYTLSSSVLNFCHPAIPCLTLK